MVWSQRRWMFLREHSANGRRCRGPRRRWWSGWGAAAKWSARTPSGLPAKYDQSLHFTIGNIAECASIVYIQWVLVQVLGRFYNESYSEWHSYTHWLDHKSPHQNLSTVRCMNRALPSAMARFAGKVQYRIHQWNNNWCESILHHCGALGQINMPLGF